MKKKAFSSIVACLFLTACSTSGDEEPTEVMVMAAASLTDALDEIKVLYEDEEDVELVINYGSSGQLREQISRGAPADLFLSASLSDMERLEEDNEVRESANVLLNQLVFIATPEAAKDLNEWTDLLSGDIQGIAMGNPESVPAGKYALQALESLDMWEEIEANTRYGSDVRQVLTYVETGNTDAGIVYETDARTSGDEIMIVDHAPEDTHDPIVYPIGLLEEAADKEETADFYEWLQTEEPLEIFESYGFNRN
ncbi:molybdate ABC transporter substrate-binding protein [Shouchella patagoniensis]|uniref:molybdate ABC transporter substrate-binding protein n=1 Tax=Shouchella patagoniensis TaxID=228576 RepID=UPI000994ED9B|nr:molybdate ABC transporter substrate-binding protein [Shouchella patagoniensis]